MAANIRLTQIAVEVAAEDIDPASVRLTQVAAETTTEAVAAAYVRATQVAAEVVSEGFPPLTPAKVALVITGHAPTIVTASITILTPAKVALVITGHAPTISGPTTTLTPAKVSLVIAGKTPTIVTGPILTPAKVALVITGHVPTITGATTLLVPAKVALAITGYVPIVLRSTFVRLTQVAAEVAKEAPASANVRATQITAEVAKEAVAAANTRLTQITAEVVSEAFPIITPAQVALVITGHAPTVTGNAMTLTPAKVALVITGKTPTVSGAGTILGSDTSALTCTDASSLAYGTDGSPGDDDTQALTITEGSAVTATGSIVIAGSDTIQIERTIAVDASVTGAIAPTGSRADPLSLTLTDASHISISGVGSAPLPLPASLDIKLTANRAHGSFRAITASESQAALYTIRDTLLSAGWTITSSISASSVIYTYVGCPIAGPTPAPRIAFLDNYCWVDGLMFTFYDSRCDTISPTPGVVWVQKGISDGSPSGNTAAVATSRVNLAGAISDQTITTRPHTTFSATVNADGNLDLISYLIGSDGNNHPVSASSYWALAGNSLFGGWLMTSQAANGVSAIQLRLTLGDFDRVMLGCFADGVQLDLGLGDLESTGDTRVSGGYHLATFAYEIYADEFQVLITPATDADVPYHSDIYIGNSSIFFSAPWVDAARSVSYCAFLIVGYSRVRKALQNMEGVCIRLNGSTYTHVSYQPTYGSAVLLYNQPDQPLRSWNADSALYQDAIIMLSEGQNNYKAVGWVWNTYITTDMPARGATGTVVYQDVTYPTFAMASNTSGTLATLQLITA